MCSIWLCPEGGHYIVLFGMQVVVWVDPLDGTSEFTDGKLLAILRSLLTHIAVNNNLEQIEIELRRVVLPI